MYLSMHKNIVSLYTDQCKYVRAISRIFLLLNALLYVSNMKSFSHKSKGVI